MIYYENNNYFFADSFINSDSFIILVHFVDKKLEFKQPWRIQPQRKANQIIFSYLEEWKIHYQNDKNFTSWKIFNTESMMIRKI